MKQLEYTIKVVTRGPVQVDDLVALLTDYLEVESAEVTNYRALPVKRVKA